MRVMDYSPIGVPSVGRLVKEKFEVEQLQDCHIYLMSSNEDAIVSEANKVFNMLMEKMGSSKLLNEYRLELLSSDIKFDNHPKLKQAIKDDMSNIVMPLSTPSRLDKQYLIVRSELKDLFTQIPLMIYTSERVSKFSIAEQMKSYAKELPDEMQEFIRECLHNDAFLKRYLAGSASNIVHPTFGMAMSKSILKGKIGIEGKITHQDKLIIMKNVEENFVKARRDENLDAQITLLIQCMDAEDMKRFVYSLNKKQQQKFFHMLNTKRTGEEADAWLEVRYEGKIQSNSRTKGRYRIYVNKGKKAELVDFTNSDAFLVHLLYIIEKVLVDDVNTLDFDRYKDLFVRLSWEVYRFEDGEERFKKIVKGRDAEGNFLRERRLNNCFREIKNSVSITCKKLGILPSPYYIKNADEHLYVSKNDIFLPSELIEIINKWKNAIHNT